MAIGALQEAAALGLRVPDDLSIVGFDGIDAAAWTKPPLTTIEQPIDEIAGTAIEALRALVDGPAQTLAELRLPPDAPRRRDDRAAAGVERVSDPTSDTAGVGLQSDTRSTASARAMSKRSSNGS